MIDDHSEQRSGKVQYTPFQIRGLRGGIEVTGAWGYRRCLDFEADNSCGQDFCAVRGDVGYVVGIVADGVSQSYYGDIAAREVSQKVMDYLWQKRAQPPAEEDFAQWLLALAGEVDPVVQETRPANPNLEEALAPVREKKGSRAVFAAFLLDFRGPREDLTLYQVGDIFSWVFHRKNGRQEEKADANGRWASRGQSDLRLRVTPLHDVAGIVIHSDGLRKVWAESLAKPWVSEQVFQAEADERAKVDDLSFIALEIRRSLPAGKEKKLAMGTAVSQPPIIVRNPRPEMAAGASGPRSGAKVNRRGATAQSRRVSSIRRYGRMHRRPLLASFAAGLAAGVVGLLLCFWFFRVSAGKTAVTPRPAGRKAGTTTKKDPVPAPAPIRATTPVSPAPVPQTFEVNQRQLSQLDFTKRFGDFPAQHKGRVGEIVAHVEFAATGASDLKVIAASGTSVLTQKCRTGESCLLAYLTGSAPRTEVTFDALDRTGGLLGRSQITLSGRQMGLSRKRFLGYYDIELTRKGKSDGKP